MAEVLVEYADRIQSPDGLTYVARACGREMDETGRWEGWLEFVDLEGRVLRSGRETTQPNRTDTVYWATGLTPVYLEGALDRTLNPVRPRPASRPAEPAFDGPAPAPIPGREAVLDPFAAYTKGEAHLRSQLLALSAWHLVNIIKAYGLSGISEVELNRMPEPALAGLIVAGVRELVNPGS